MTDETAGKESIETAVAPEESNETAVAPEEFSEDGKGSDEEFDVEIRSITGTPISLDTYTEDPYPLIERGIIKSETVRVGQELTITVQIDAKVTTEDQYKIGGIAFFFFDGDRNPIASLNAIKAFAPIYLDMINGSTSFTVPAVGARRVFVIGVPATRLKASPNTISDIDRRFFRVANLKIIP